MSGATNHVIIVVAPKCSVTRQELAALVEASPGHAFEAVEIADVGCSTAPAGTGLPEVSRHLAEVRGEVAGEGLFTGKKDIRIGDETDFTNAAGRGTEAFDRPEVADESVRAPEVDTVSARANLPVLADALTHPVIGGEIAVETDGAIKIVVGRGVETDFTFEPRLRADLAADGEGAV